jgi:hypothetical protein
MEFTFSNIIELLRNLTLNEKEEVRNLLEHNIAEEKREIFHKEYLKSKKEYKTGKLVFSEKINDLRKMI